MRIGIHPALKRHDGGIYQYSLTVLRALHDLSDSTNHEFAVFAHDLTDPALGELSHPRWALRTFRPRWGPQSCIDLTAPCDPDAPMQQTDMRQWLLENGVDLTLYTAPHRLSFESGVPFVMAVHDVQHRLQPEFPEVSEGGEWTRREYVYRNAARSGLRLVTNSQTGADDMLTFYGPEGLSPDRLAVLPYPTPAIAATHLRDCVALVSKKHKLPTRFLFYPAQFWPHKNHLGLIEALAIARNRYGTQIPIVLSGSKSGPVREAHFSKTMARARALGLADQVTCLGYVSDDELLGLYGRAEALVMPTFFGPTSLPVLEAWAVGCPVIASDVPGNREQVAQAGLLIDPKNPDDIAEKIHQLWTRPQLRTSLIEKGSRRCAGYTMKDFAQELLRILDDAAAALHRENSVAARREILLQGAGC